MAMKAARDRAKDERGVTEPQLLAPVSAHPAFAKAAHYLGLEHVQIPIDGNYKADLRETERLIGDRTAVVVGSCPNYPFGTADPIPEMAAMASERGISFHTDACLGGFLLPFYEKLGEPVPPFDFRVPGVTTISADVHKYGYATKGASIVTHRDGEHLKKYQRFLYDRWPGGLYLSFAMAGARPAAPIAAAWAILHYLGEEGYVKLAAQIRDAVKQIQAGIADIPELTVVGEPIMSVFAFTAAEGSGIDPFAVGDAMDQKGWCIDRQHGPNALHLMISPKHLSVVDAFLSDLRDAVKNHGPSQGKEIRYS